MANYKPIVSVIDCLDNRGVAVWETPKLGER